jgi:hypothetical protein
MVLLGSTTVMINGRMAVRVGDVLQGSGPPNSFIPGQATVLIGDIGFGMGLAALRAAFATAMHTLLGNWDKQTQDERLASIQAALGAAKAPSMPHLEVRPVALDPSLHGQLDFTRWQIDINESLIAGEMDAPRMAALSNTLYHEARHGEQWYNAAQSQAAFGADSQTIANDLHIPRTVATAAVSDPAPRGTPAGEMGAAVHTSVYGSRAQHRNDTLTHLDSDDNYTNYRVLPEEEDAWRQGDLVEANFKALK